GMGTVVGETSVIGDHVFLFHNVTLGGTGHAAGDRHPKVGNHVVIGTGATLLGNLHIGDHAVIAAGSVVLKDVPPNTTVAGIPAKVKGPARELQ
ncbi:MAG TPA: serine O-acetyltransferase, partial [Cytophagales bacterium]|nr:serine O-acetyltransferase [Cytophagales bacterium]